MSYQCVYSVAPTNSKLDYYPFVFVEGHSQLFN